MQFKIRCSSIGHIMGRCGLTDKQQETLLLLESKQTRTVAQERDYLELIKKRDNESLPEGAKTYLRGWAKKQLYKRTREITTKYFAKGITVEDQAIDMLADYLGEFILVKNETSYEDEHMKGTPDVICKPRKGIEVKSPWDFFTFPAFEYEIPNHAYWWQCQGYMALTGLPLFQLCYVLCDMPYDQIAQEAKSRSWKMGLMGEVSDELYEEIEAQLTYSDIPIDQRIKIFDIHRDDKAIQQIRDRVEQCRTFLGNLEY